MADQDRPLPPALPHGPVEQVLPGLHFVSGTIAMKGPVTMRFSRAMTVVVEGDRVVLVNSVRLDEEGLAALDRLGRVTDVLRLAGFHGMDDAFYKRHYGAKIWAVRGQNYNRGFNDDPARSYFSPDVQMDASTELPIAGARLIVIDSKPPEGLLLLDRAGGVLVTGDALQNWASTDAYFNLPASLMMRVMGFIKPANVGPGWYRQAKPPLGQVRGILDLDFENVLPSHGLPILGGAKERFRPAIERLS